MMARVRNNEVDVRALAKIFGITADPARDPAGFIMALKVKLKDVISTLEQDSPDVSPDAPVEGTQNRRGRFIENGDPAWGETNDPLPMPGDMLR